MLFLLSRPFPANQSYEWNPVPFSRKTKILLLTYITLFNSGVVLEEAVALIVIKLDIRLSHNPVYLELQDRVNHFLKFCKSFLEILHYFLTKFSHVAKLCNILTKLCRVDFFVNLLIMTCYEICYQSVTFFFMMNTKNLNRSWNSFSYFA